MYPSAALSLATKRRSMPTHLGGKYICRDTSIGVMGIELAGTLNQSLKNPIVGSSSEYAITLRIYEGEKLQLRLGATKAIPPVLPFKIQVP